MERESSPSARRRRSASPAPDQLRPVEAHAERNLPVPPDKGLTDLTHSIDPADYDWIPVARKKRADGWSPWCQRRFIEELAERGSVEQAAREVGKTVQSAYRLRRAPGSEEFDAAWSAAIDQSSKKLLDDAFERALVGTDEPIFDRDGRRVGRRFRQSDKLLMFLLRAYMPDRFRYAGRETLMPDESKPPPLARIADAIALLGPPVPDAPHLTMDAHQLRHRIDFADNGETLLPDWRDDARPEPKPDRMPLGEAFERGLEDAKREGSGRPPLTDEEWEAHRKMLMG